MKRFFLLFSAIAFSTIVFGQDCNLYFLSKEGASLEYNQFNAKKKPAGHSIHKITSKKNIPGGVELGVEATSFDKDNKEVVKSNFTVKCENGVFLFEMNNYFNTQGQQNTNWTFKGDNLDIPSNPSVGQTLKDGAISISMPENPVFSMTMRIYNRKVEAMETITTPAGTFECVKITYDAETKMMFTIKTKGTEWYAKDVGMIKSESYDSNGKLTGYTELSKIIQ